MPRFESPLGSKQFSGQPMKEIDVPDESGYTPPAQSQNHGHRHESQHNYVLDENSIREFNARMNPVQQSAQTHEINEFEKQMQEAKRAKRLGLERLSDGAKKRIEMLLGMTKLTRSVQIDGNQYVLQTLTSKEIREAVTASAEFNNSVQFAFETKKQFLGRSLVQVAGVDIEQFLNSNELETRLLFVEEMDHSLAVRLYNEYIILAKESEAKYSLKTENDTKEIVDDLKK